MIIKGVLFDVIGTVIKEKSQVINNCFEKAFRENNIPVETNLIRENRGKEKSEIIKNVLSKLNYPLSLYRPILNSFIKNLDNSLDSFSENDGFNETIKYLKNKEIKIGVGTGLPPQIFEKIFHHFNWAALKLDYIKTSEETGSSRPNPRMILDMLKKFHINSSEFLKVGDTTADIYEGKNANVVTAVILSGTQDKDEILKAGPDYIFSSLKELIEII